MISLKVNGKQYQVEVAPDTPLLWVIRESVGLTGTKFGCGISQCGACTVHVNGEAVRSCVTPSQPLWTKRSSPSRGFPPTTAIRCSRPGSKMMCPNVAIAIRGRSCRRPPFWPRTRSRVMPTSMRPCRETSVDAGPISASAGPSIAPPK